MSDYTIPPFTVQTISLALEGKDIVSWGETITGIPEPWKGNKGKATDGRRVRVAVCDTGADEQHVKDGDLVGTECFDLTGTGKFCSGDADNHGTHCLGIIGARSNDRGTIGFLPECVLGSFKCMVNGSGSSASIARAIRAAVDWGADIISLSLGTMDPDQTMAEAVRVAVSNGRIVVAAAGNSGRPNDVNYPARWKKPHGDKFLDCLAIGAVQRDGTLAPYSSMGPEVDFCGPGSDIPSCWARGGYANLSGTSMATPAIVGLVGLVKVRHWDLGEASKTPFNTHDEVREHFRQHAKDIGQAGDDDASGWGLVLLPPDKPVDSPAPPPGMVCGTVVLQRWGYALVKVA